jgi:hypothetical protein
MCWVWVLLYYWFYYCRLLYYVFVVLTLIVLWTFICIFILHYYSLWNHVKISFWTCYHMSLWSVRYCLVNTETEPKVPKPNFLGIDFWKEPIGTYFPRNRILWEPKYRTDRFGVTKCPGWVRWIRSPPAICIWFQLVLGSISVLFILGISSLQEMSYFGRSHYNASNLAFCRLGVAPGP